MSKAKAPEWLREAFRDGVEEHVAHLRGLIVHPHDACFLARHDDRRRPCSGPYERFHFINRQRVENAMAALLPYAWEADALGAFLTETEWTRDDLILLAAWDPRNGGIACEGHHRRFDSHLTPPLTVPRLQLPARVIEFVTDNGIEHELDSPRFR
jgi:hypothetical protein